MEQGNNNFNNIYGNNYYDQSLNNWDSKPEKAKPNLKIVIIIIIAILIIPSVIIIKNLLKSYNVVFNLNGADKIDAQEMRCKSNIKGECFLTLPSSLRTNGEVLGYSLNKDNTVADYKVGEKIEITKDTEMYVISKKENTLSIDTSAIDDVRDNNIKCEIYNSEETCEVEVPIFNKLGYRIEGYKENNKEDMIKFGSKIKINDDIKLTPIYKEHSYYEVSGTIHFNIGKSVYLYNTYIDIDSDCNAKMMETFIENLKKLYQTYPFLSYNSKISVLGSKQYNAFTSKVGVQGSVGITNENEPENPTVLVECSNYFSPYITAIHELAHTLDVRYKMVSGHFFNEEQELIDLRNKYMNMRSRPLRSYAFSDKGNSSVPEFFAELITYYYLNYVDTEYSIDVSDYKRGNYPNDMKLVAEKYLCIGRNNYDRTKCS